MMERDEQDLVNFKSSRRVGRIELEGSSESPYRRESVSKGGKIGEGQKFVWKTSEEGDEFDCSVRKTPWVLTTGSGL